MNEPQDTPISVTSESLYEVDSAYSENGDIIPVECNYTTLSVFPWISFLGETGTLYIESDIHIFGLDESEEKFRVSVDAIDNLGFYMINESAKIRYKQEAYDADWNKLPTILSWLYIDKPYITSKDLNIILPDLKEAIQLESASEDLLSYVETHTYKKPIKTQSYNSYGAYFNNDMLDKHGNVSKVLMNLGFSHKDVKNSLLFNTNNDEITILGNSKNIEIVIQQRIGGYTSAQVLHIKSDNTYIHTIYLSTLSTNIFTDTRLNTSQRFQLDLMLLYNISKQCPIWCDKNIIYVEREVPISILTSESGSAGTVSVELRTESTVIPTMTEVGPLSTNYLMFDNEIIQIDTVENDIIYSEYLVIRT